MGYDIGNYLTPKVAAKSSDSSNNNAHLSHHPLNKKYKICSQFLFKTNLVLS
jgi:hypothetical protein